MTVLPEIVIFVVFILPCPVHRSTEGAEKNHNEI